MTKKALSSAWLPFGTHPGCSVRILCFPHAGAGASAYRAWGLRLPTFVGVCPVQPPGREKRHLEKPLTTVAALVTGLAPEIIANIRRPYALFGHSTGALCAFELARKIRALGGPAPVHLFVAGRRAPQLPMSRTDIGQFSMLELKAYLQDLGGTPDEVLAKDDLLRNIQPLLAADFSINEGYAYQPEPALDVPITAFAATHDAGANPHLMIPWHRQSSSGFRMHTLRGGHFALFDHAEEVRDQIADTLRPFS